MVKTYGAYTFVEVGPCEDGAVYPVWYSPTVVAFLNRISNEGLADIVWLTTWVHEARTMFAPAVGLNDFCALTDMRGSRDSRTVTWWKYARVREFMEQDPHRRVVWLDDELSTVVKKAFRAEFDPARNRSHLPTVQSNPGLRPSDMEAVEEFLRS